MFRRTAAERVLLLRHYENSPQGRWAHPSLTCGILTSVVVIFDSILFLCSEERPAGHVAAGTTVTPHRVIGHPPSSMVSSKDRSSLS